MPNYAQVFCTLDDLITDLESPGGNVTRMMQAIKDASDYLQKEIGWFIPISETLKLRGSGARRMWVPPILSVSSIVNDTTTLSASDYFLIGEKTSRPWWLNGPYTQLEVDPDSSALTYWCASEPDSVQISCLRGLYLKSVLTGATVADTTQQSDIQTTLKVSNGALVSPGMALLLDSEQELVTGYGSPSASSATLNGLIDSSTEEITVNDASLINAGEVFRIDFEQFKCRDRNTSTNKLHVFRGWNTTSRVQHLNGAAVEVYRTYNVERACNGTTAASHTNGLAIYRYDPPDDIRFLAREGAVLMLNKAKSGYAGRSGNDQTGTTFYNDAFPRFDIERIKEKYQLP